MHRPEGRRRAPFVVSGRSCPPQIRRMAGPSDDPGNRPRDRLPNRTDGFRNGLTDDHSHRRRHGRQQHNDASSLIAGRFDPTAQASVETGVEDDPRHRFAEFVGKADRSGPIAVRVAIGGQGDLGCLFPGVFGP